VELAGRRAAVIGCGGAGRGAAEGLLRAGAIPTIVNRGQARGRYAADLLGIDYVPLSRFAPADYSLIVHATPVRDEPPFAVDRIAEDAVVVDFAYGQGETRLTAEARARDQVVVDGYQVLEVEVERQFRLLTGRSVPDPAGSPDGSPAASPQKEFAR
jgi:3-dehydroquinate dehydratase/shikimate dehydrogenase